MFCAYSDSDYAGRMHKRRSRTGWVVFFNDNYLSMGSYLQANIATSTTEAEFYAATDACKECLFWTQLWQNLPFSTMFPPQERLRLFVDNSAARLLCEKRGCHKRTKHIDVRYYFVHSPRVKGVIRILPVASVDNRADANTKRGKHSTHRAIFLGMNRHSPPNTRLS